MNYNYQYVKDIDTGLISSEIIKRLPDNALIPNNPDNRDWKAYQVWLSQGNVPLDPD